MMRVYFSALKLFLLIVFASTQGNRDFLWIFLIIFKEALDRSTYSDYLNYPTNNNYDNSYPNYDYFNNGYIPNSNNNVDGFYNFGFLVRNPFASRRTFPLQDFLSNWYPDRNRIYRIQRMGRQRRNYYRSGGLAARQGRSFLNCFDFLGWRW